MHYGFSLGETQRARAEHHEKDTLEIGARVGRICSGSSCKYLGFWIGPGATVQTNWEGPVTKLQTSVKELSAAAVPASMATLRYQYHCVGVHRATSGFAAWRHTDGG